MKNMGFWVVLTIILVGCKEPQTVFEQKQSPAGMAFSQDQPHSLEDYIGKENYDVVVHSDSIKIMKIESVPVDSAKTEFGRRAQFLKNYEVSQKWRTENILKNEYYSQVDEENFQFDPDFQFEMNHNGRKLSLLLDENTDSLGFISLEGQIVLKITDILKEEFLKIAEEKSQTPEP